MASISTGFPSIPSGLTLYTTTDSSQQNTPLLVFYGPSTTTNSTGNSSRVQAHIFGVGGHSSYQRITVSPTSPLYQAVQFLPRELQGDETYRGLAFCLNRYFSELPESIKTRLAIQPLNKERGGQVSFEYTLFSEGHAGAIAGRLTKSENQTQVLADLQAGLGQRTLSKLLVEIVLPPQNTWDVEDESSDLMFGPYEPLLRTLGEEVAKSETKVSDSNSNRPVEQFSREHKISVRRDMCEFVDTEERYIAKIYDLITNIASELKHGSRTKLSATGPMPEQFARDIFPPYLETILEANTFFLDSVRIVLDDTEEAAMAEMQGATPADGSGDATGLLEFSRTIKACFPHFADCYPQYLAINSETLQALSNALKDSTSAFARRVQQLGEQKLKSLLIEPVQRLPRYTLFIDSLLAKVPKGHPAIANLNEARKVIADICSLTSPLAAQAQGLLRLSHMVHDWPESLVVKGNLVSVTPAIELPPPYHLDLTAPRLFLIAFIDCLLVLQATTTNTFLSSQVKDIILGKDPASSSRRTTMTFVEEESSFHFRLKAVSQVANLRFSECPANKTVFVHFLNGVGMGGRTVPTSRVYYLKDAFEGGAGAWFGNVQRRFLERELKLQGILKWSVREVPGNDQAGLLVSVIQSEGQETLHPISSSTISRIIVDPSKYQHPLHDPESALIEGSAKWNGPNVTLSLKAPTSRSAKDKIRVTEFPDILTERLTQLTTYESYLHESLFCQTTIDLSKQLLRSLRLNGTDGNRSMRTPSPVKIITHLLSGSSSVGRSPARVSLSKLDPVPPLRPLKSLNPIQQPPAKDKPKTGDIPQITLIKQVGDEDEEAHIMSSEILEAVLQRYVECLRSTQGSHITRFLTNRHVPDLDAVISARAVFEDVTAPVPGTNSIPLQVQFAAFDGFLHVTWTQSMGHLIPGDALASIQIQSEILSVADFVEYFKSCLEELTPQNRRAFTAIITLLGDLLGSADNDADKGTLTALFAGFLVTDADSRLYIPLLDHIVQNMDAILAESPIEPPPVAQPLASSASSISSGSLKRNRSINFGSSRPPSSARSESNSGSIRRRLGLGSLRRSGSKSSAISNSSGGGFGGKARLWRSQSERERPSDGGMSSSNSSSSSLAPRASTLLQRSQSTIEESGHHHSSMTGAGDGSGSLVGKRRIRPEDEAAEEDMVLKVGPRPGRESSHRRTPLDTIFASPPNTHPDLKSVAEGIEGNSLTVPSSTVASANAVARKKSRKFFDR